MAYGVKPSKDTNLAGNYIVWNPSSNLPPTLAYPDRPTAIKVAHMMAAKNHGEQFTVCKIVGSAKTTVTKFESYED